MHLIVFIMLTFFFSSTAYCQPVKGKGIGKEEAIELATRWTESAHPSVNLKNMNVKAVFVSKENQWIIRFSYPSSPDVVAYMVRVEATSGHYPQFLKGSQIERYEQYFGNVGNTEREDETERNINVGLTGTKDK